MKNYILKTGFLLFIGLLITSFTSFKDEKKVIDTSKSTLEWLGTKVTGKHNGTIKLKSGYFNFQDKKLVGGEFVVDMKTIVCNDLQGEYKAKLEAHLSSDDFFGVANFAESTFKITRLGVIAPNKYKVTGDLTIKGKTFENSFVLEFEGNKAQGTLVVDRTKYGIKYGSGSFFDNLGDKAISDNFELKISLVF
ncbi:MAG: YceI family protein [Flavobacteriaceae bacterium]|nr:YceI family protein [Flavobacteriaceae bacterium]